MRDHVMAVTEGLEPSMTGLTARRFTNLATPQYLCFVLDLRSLGVLISGRQVQRTKIKVRWEIWWLWVDSNHQPHAYETYALSN